MKRTMGTILVILIFAFLVHLPAFSATPPPPTIASFSPKSGATGTLVNITGTNFTSAAAGDSVKPEDPRLTLNVQFGGTDAASFTIHSSTEITAEVGNGSTGKITVTAPGGVATSSESFTYIPPIPTLNEWAMVAFAAILIVAALPALKKRKEAL